MVAEDEVALLERWRAGEHAAGNALMARYYDPIWRFFELKVPAAAQDLTQKTFVSVVEGREAFRGDGSFRAYLFGIARRHYFHYVRDTDRARRVVGFDQPEEGTSPMTSPSRVVARKQEHHVLLRALDTLGDDARMALQLFYWEGMKNREIAEVLGVSTSAVTSRLARARAQLREAVETLPAASVAVRASVAEDLEGWAVALIAQPLQQWTAKTPTRA